MSTTLVSLPVDIFSVFPPLHNPRDLVYSVTHVVTFTARTTGDKVLVYVPAVNSSVRVSSTIVPSCACLYLPVCPLFPSSATVSVYPLPPSCALNLRKYCSLLYSHLRRHTHLSFTLGTAFMHSTQSTLLHTIPPSPRTLSRTPSQSNTPQTTPSTHKYQLSRIGSISPSAVFT